jgi:methyl-accepting chemotaxis protein
MSTTPRPILGLLQRSAQKARAKMGSQKASAEHELWLVHGRASERAREAGALAQRLSTTAARQRGSVDAAFERARAAAARTKDLPQAVAPVGQALDRLSLVALNAGLEGARLGETAGRALLLVSDEVRDLVGRGGEAVRELGRVLEELGADWNDVHVQIGVARDLAGDVAEEAARTFGASSELERALADISDPIRRATGSDPETAHALAEVAEHGRALVIALGALSGRVPRALLVRALGPALEALSALVEDRDGAGDKRKRRERG